MDNFEKICRICLKTEGQQEFTRIFSKGKEIALKLNLISGIKVCCFWFIYFMPALCGIYKEKKMFFRCF